MQVQTRCGVEVRIPSSPPLSNKNPRKSGVFRVRTVRNLGPAAIFWLHNDYTLLVLSLRRQRAKFSDLNRDRVAVQSLL